MVTLFIGLNLIFSALLFTVPKKSVSDKSFDANSQRKIDAEGQTNELALPESNDIFFVRNRTHDTAFRGKTTRPARLSFGTISFFLRNSPSGIFNAAKKSTVERRVNYANFYRAKIQLFE